MHRHYYISDDLDDLKAAENEFYDSGFSKPQLHVLSEQDSELVKHQLNEVDSLSKSDLIHGGTIGAIIGAVISMSILGFGAFSGAATFTDWIPFLFLSCITFGFCVWEGGLFGIQVKNVEFRRFEEVLKNGMHVLLIDISEEQRSALEAVIRRHPKLNYAGVGSARPSWLIRGQNNFNSIVQTLP